VTVVVAERLSKRFFATQALDQVSLELAAGEVHAIVGENGAGKSTLIKILAGIHQADTGRIFVDGVARRFGDPREALGAGLALIPQELRLVPALSVAENVMLGHLPLRRRLGLPVVDRRSMYERAGVLLARLGFRGDPDIRVDALAHAERQLVAIARALSRRARVLILDEPTAALEAREVRRLFETIAALKRDGVGIIYISHRLEEVLELGDRCTVLRDGRAVATIERSAFDLTSLVRHITGRDVEATSVDRRRPVGTPLLAGEGVSLAGGEVLAIAGLLGSGADRVLRRLFGAAGRITVERGDRCRLLRRPADGVEAGLGYVGADRAQGIVQGASVRDNILLAALDRAGRGPGGVWWSRAAADAIVGALMDALDIRPRDPDRPVRELSGGNQQKLLFARWLAAEVTVLLLDEPTQGIDVKAKGQIQRLIREFAARGGGVVFASTDFSEVLSTSDAVLAMRQGAVVAWLPAGGLTERHLRAALQG